MGSLVLLDLMGGVALLLWGLHMVHSGILRAFGPDLRRALARALGNRFSAFAAGLGLTALLQSSTATALMTSSFTTEGIVGLVPALAIMLGANVGTMLLALHILLDTLAPAEQAPAVRALLAAVTGDPLLCVLIAAALTWAAHSSVAIVLLVMSLAFSQ